MIYQNDYFFERFDVLFGRKSCIVAGKEYPLGYIATEGFCRISENPCASKEKPTSQITFTNDLPTKFEGQTCIKHRNTCLRQILP